MDQLLTREFGMKNNTDPRGIKWGIGKIKGTALYHISVLEGSKNTSKPPEVDSNFTNPTLAQQAIENYLKRAWSESDLYAVKNARKEHKTQIEQ